MRRGSLASLPAAPLPEGWEVRRVRAEEEGALAEVLMAAFGTPWDASAVRRNLTEAADVEAVYVAACGDRVGATASARRDARFPGSGYLHWVGVHPDLRGLGLGAAVTVRVLQHFADSGCPDVVLETDDFRLSAVRLYLRLGFAPEIAHTSHADRWKAVLRSLG